MATHYDHNLFALKRQLEIQTGQAYSWVFISDKTGISQNTLINLSRNKTRRVDLDIVGRLVDFFRAEGLPVTIADLFVEVEFNG